MALKLNIGEIRKIQRKIANRAGVVGATIRSPKNVLQQKRNVRDTRDLASVQRAMLKDRAVSTNAERLDRFMKRAPLLARKIKSKAQDLQKFQKTWDIRRKRPGSLY